MSTYMMKIHFLFGEFEYIRKGIYEREERILALACKAALVRELTFDSFPQRPCMCPDEVLAANRPVVVFPRSIVMLETRLELMLLSLLPE